MPEAYVWHETNDDQETGYFWDDAEDHGGFDRNVPCGPFDTHDLAVQDAIECFRETPTVLEGKPHRYGV